MNREIKFRGYHMEKGWIYGSLNQKTLSNRISFYNKLGYWIELEVLEGTIGQFTGLKDKNGVPIYEGDVVADNRNEKYEVVFDNMNLCYSGKRLKTLELFQLNKNNVLMVLGNKYSNTELLKKDGK